MVILLNLNWGIIFNNEMILGKVMVVKLILFGVLLKLVIIKGDMWFLSLKI